MMIMIFSLFEELIENTRKYIFSLTHNRSSFSNAFGLYCKICIIN